MHGEVKHPEELLRKIKKRENFIPVLKFSFKFFNLIDGKAGALGNCFNINSQGNQLFGNFPFALVDAVGFSIEIY